MDEYIKREDALKALQSVRDCLADSILKHRHIPDFQKEVFEAIISAAERVINRIPTADVAPKSEVEKLICKLECLLCHVTGGRLSKHTYDLATMETVATDCINETYNDGYGEGYKDCATEIFAEIESNIYPMLGLENDKEYVAILSTTFAELKKKYTQN